MKRIRYLLLAAVMIVSAVATAQNIEIHQYWIDGNIDNAVTSTSAPTGISISDLKPGLHSLTVRVKDSEGLWSSQVAKYFIKPFVENGVADNGIKQHQYWIDGNLQAAVTSTSQPSAIVIDDLKPGLHSLTVRVQDKAGLWSSQVAKYFIVPFVSNDVTNKTIEEHQYWIDGKIEARVTQEQQPTTIDISNPKLKPGLHSFTVRVKDNTGMWSSQVAKYFIVPTAETSVGDKSIVLHQYWIDGKLDAIVSSETQPSQIPISTLKPGLHSLTVRVKDNTGLWSSQVAKYFILKDDDVMEETTITRYMYWFDEETDDFFTGPLTSASGTMDIDISDVEAGIHTLWWRCGDSKGAWSEARSVTFESKSLYNYTVPGSGIGTFSADVNLTLPDGLKAHFCTYLKEVDEGLAIKILNIDGKVINQNTGVLLSGTPGETYQLRYTSEAGSATDGNKLVPVVESTHVEPVVGDYTNYIMQGGQFIKIKQEEAGNEDIKMPAHRAYLPLLTTDVSPTSGGAKSVVLLLWDDDVVTGIESTEKVDYEPARDGHVYSISGQRLSAPRKGINIINGRKVIVK
jgi:hypothetical protein